MLPLAALPQLPAAGSAPGAGPCSSPVVLAACWRVAARRRRPSRASRGEPAAGNAAAALLYGAGIVTAAAVVLAFTSSPRRTRSVTRRCGSRPASDDAGAAITVGVRSDQQRATRIPAGAGGPTAAADPTPSAWSRAKELPSNPRPAARDDGDRLAVPPERPGKGLPPGLPRDPGGGARMSPGRDPAGSSTS